MIYSGKITKCLKMTIGTSFEVKKHVNVFRGQIDKLYKKTTLVQIMSDLGLLGSILDINAAIKHPEMTIGV